MLRRICHILCRVDILLLDLTVKSISKTLIYNSLHRLQGGIHTLFVHSRMRTFAGSSILICCVQIKCLCSRVCKCLLTTGRVCQLIHANTSTIIPLVRTRYKSYMNSRIHSLPFFFHSMTTAKIIWRQQWLDRVRK